MDEGAAFVDRLIIVVPELRKTYMEHVSNNDTLLPHVFMGDVARFIVAQARKPENHELIRRFVTFLEEENSDPSEEVSELIVVSFLENLLGEDVAVKQLRSLMGFKLRSQLKRVFDG